MAHRKNPPHLAAAAFELLEPRALMAVGTPSEQIIVDQIGYRTDAARKMAIFADPINGQNGAVTYTPGTTFQVRRTSDDAVVFTGNTVTWKAGQTDTVSGDKVWTGDFSAFKTAGEYYLLDVTNSLRSYPFRIDNNLFNDVLKTSNRTFYYQRTGTAIDAAHGGNWTHAIDHVGPNQDTQARQWANGAVVAGSTVRDLSGGWFDAGDYNKYVPFTTGVLWNLLTAYEWNPGAFGDNTNIPESGNGTPDTLDEVKYELDWLLKMQTANGSVLNRVANATYNAGNYDPSTDTQPRYYTAATTWATASFAASTAHASRVFRTFNPAYADTLLAASRAAWAYLNATPTMTPASGNDGGGSGGSGGGLAAAGADSDTGDDLRLRILASAELYKTTGEVPFKTYFEANAKNAAASVGGFHPLLGGYTRFDASQAMDLNHAYVTYATSTSTNATLVTEIKTSLKHMVDDQIIGAVNSESDPYRAFMWDGHYTWGSNQLKSEWANLLTFAIKLNVNAANTAKYREAGEEYVHYILGRNPLNQNYLSNIGIKGVDLGADKPAMEVYHSWFGDGSAKYDGTTSLYGPVPGYLVGGPNQFYGGSLTGTPRSNPPAKSFKDWNTSWPENSWEITEPAIYYQAAFQLLLSQFATDTHAPHATSSTFDVGTAPHAVKVKFDEDVGASLTSSAELTLDNLTSQTTIDPSQLALNYDASARTATFTYNGGTLPDGDYRATIRRTNVTDAAGNPLAADAVVTFFVLAGDANHDRTVDFQDLVILSQNYNQTGRTFAQGNLDYSAGGTIDFADLVILSQRYNATLGTAPTIMLSPTQAEKTRKPTKSPLKELA
jgi:endoglucanase